MCKNLTANAIIPSPFTIVPFTLIIPSRDLIAISQRRVLFVLSSQYDLSIRFITSADLGVCNKFKCLSNRLM